MNRCLRWVVSRSKHQTVGSAKGYSEDCWLTGGPHLYQVNGSAVHRQVRAARCAALSSHVRWWDCTCLTHCQHWQHILTITTFWFKSNQIKTPAFPNGHTRTATVKKLTDKAAYVTQLFRFVASCGAYTRSFWVLTGEATGGAFSYVKKTSMADYFDIHARPCRNCYVAVKRINKQPQTRYRWQCS